MSNNNKINLILLYDRKYKKIADYFVMYHWKVVGYMYYIHKIRITFRFKNVISFELWM